MSRSGKPPTATMVALLSKLETVNRNPSIAGRRCSACEPNIVVPVNQAAKSADPLLERP